MTFGGIISAAERVECVSYDWARTGALERSSNAVIVINACLKVFLRFLGFKAADRTGTSVGARRALVQLSSRRIVRRGSDVQDDGPHGPVTHGIILL